MRENYKKISYPFVLTVGKGLEVVKLSNIFVQRLTLLEIPRNKKLQSILLVFHLSVLVLYSYKLMKQIKHS